MERKRATLATLLKAVTDTMRHPESTDIELVEANEVGVKSLADVGPVRMVLPTPDPIPIGARQTYTGRMCVL
jgi:hypothetical protein